MTAFNVSLDETIHVLRELPANGSSFGAARADDAPAVAMSRDTAENWAGRMSHMQALKNAEAEHYARADQAIEDRDYDEATSELRKAAQARADAEAYFAATREAYARVVHESADFQAKASPALEKTVVDEVVAPMAALMSASPAMASDSDTAPAAAASKDPFKTLYDKLFDKAGQEAVQHGLFHSHGDTHQFGVLSFRLDDLAKVFAPKKGEATAAVGGESVTVATEGAKVDDVSRFLFKVGLSIDEENVAGVPAAKKRIGIVGGGYRLNKYFTLDAGWARQGSDSDLFVGVSTPLTIFGDLF